MGLKPQELKNFVDGRARVVWVQQQERCDDFLSLSPDFKVMACDTEDGERCLTPKSSAYTTARIATDGSRVVYTDNYDQTVHVINWDDTDDRVIAEQMFAMTVWRDPKSDIEWVYLRPHKGKEWNQKSSPVTRIQLNNPEVSELVWDQRRVSNCWFQHSPDGKYVAAAMFWPNCGYAHLETGEWTFVDKGCWTAMAPDNSYRMWVYDSDHRRVKMYNLDGEKIATIDIHQAEGINGWETYYPRWSNHLRFMTMAGPFSDNRDHPCDMSKWETYLHEGQVNLIRQGGFNVELYLGKFNPEVTQVDEWLKITENNKADFHGDAWIEKTE